MQFPLYPQTGNELWRHILGIGGIKRSRTYWDSRASVEENRRCYRFLDRAWDCAGGWHIDELGVVIGEAFPWFGIETGEDLWEWLQVSQ